LADVNRQVEGRPSQLQLARSGDGPNTDARLAPVSMTRRADDELWSAIADPSRRGVLDLLVTNGEVSASWLAGQVAFSRQAVSKHLVVLEQTGLVSRRKQGREVLYRVEVDRLDQAARAMADLAAQWDRRLAAIKRLAEAAHAEAAYAEAEHGEALKGETP
jgi:DNA-binding transcriptional ArsR family regulator